MSELETISNRNFLNFCYLHNLDSNSHFAFWKWNSDDGYLFKYDSEYRKKLFAIKHEHELNIAHSQFLNEEITLEQCTEIEDQLTATMNYFDTIYTELTLPHLLNRSKNLVHYENVQRLDLDKKFCDELKSLKDSEINEWYEIAEKEERKAEEHALEAEERAQEENLLELMENLASSFENQFRDGEYDLEEYDPLEGYNPLEGERIWDEILQEDEQQRLQESSIRQRLIDEEELAALGDVEYNPECHCVICMARQQNIKFLPCGHTNTCRTCSTRILPDCTGKITCPICRSTIDEIVDLEQEFDPKADTE